ARRQLSLGVSPCAMWSFAGPRVGIADSPCGIPPDQPSGSPPRAKVTRRRSTKVQRADHSNGLIALKEDMMQSMKRWLAHTSLLAFASAALACGRDMPSSPADAGANKATQPTSGSGQPDPTQVLSITPNALALQIG